jgi:hypothetical protein
MSWCAETAQAQLAANTELAAFEGQPVRPLPSDVSLALRFPNGAVASIYVQQS